jgi:hypothetical protein
VAGLRPSLLDPKRIYALLQSGRSSLRLTRQGNRGCAAGEASGLSDELDATNARSPPRCSPSPRGQKLLRMRKAAAPGVCYLNAEGW